MSPGPSVPAGVPRRYARLALTLAIGALGAVGAVLVNIPLALLLGPLFAVMVAALAGVKLHVPDALRTTILSLLGAFLASKFTPDVIAGAAQWPISLAMIPVYIVACATLAGLYFRYFAGMDRISSVFAAIPGGLVTMIVIGASFGGDERRIAIAHVLRIVLSVFIVTYVLWGVFGMQRDQSGIFTEGLDADLGELALVVGVALTGAYGAHRLRCPAPQFLGPLLCVAPLYVTETVTVAIPGPALAVALWVLGSSIGSRFSGFDHRTLARMAGHTFVSVMLLLAIALGIAGLLWALLDIPLVAGPACICTRRCRRNVAYRTCPERRSGIRRSAPSAAHCHMYSDSTPDRPLG